MWHCPGFTAASGKTSSIQTLALVGICLGVVVLEAPAESAGDCALYFPCCLQRRMGPHCRLLCGSGCKHGGGREWGGCWWWWYGGERGLQHFLWERGHGVRELGLLSPLSLAASGSALWLGPAFPEGGVAGQGEGAQVRERRAMA